MGHEAVASISRENWKRLRNSTDRRQLFEGFDIHVCGAPETPLYGIDSWKNLQLIELGEREGLCVDVATEDGAMPKPSRGCLSFCKFQVDRSCP